MNKRFFLSHVIVLLVFLTIFVSVFVAQTRPKTERASTGDIKVRYRQSMGGAGSAQPGESVTMIKGPRSTESHQVTAMTRSMLSSVI